MADDIDQFKQAFGKAIVKRDREALDVLLAPWITVQAALDLCEASMEEMRGEWELPENSWPVECESSAGVLDYEGLREMSSNGFPPGQNIPEQVTADNYEGWHVITAYPPEDAEFDAYFDAWFAVVRLPDGLHVGSLEIVDPD